MARVSIAKLIAPGFFCLHRDLKHKRHTHYWLKGGRASTKSSFISLEVVLGMLRDPNASAIVYRKVANTLADSVVAQMLWAIEALGLTRYWQYKKSPYELIYKPTGQRILFRGADDAEKSKGIKLASGYFGYVWFEELSEFGGMEEIETILRSLLRGEGKAAVLYSYNPPKSVNNWVNAEALRPRADRLVHHSTYLDVPAAWLGEQFLAEAEHTKKAHGMKYRWAYLGEATGTGGAVFDNATVRRISDAEIETFGKLYDGLDFGYTIDPTAYVVMHYQPQRKRLFVFDEFYSTSAGYDRIAQEIQKRNPGRPVIADSAEPRSIDELKGRGIRCYGAKKGPGSVEHGMKWLQDLEEIIIDSHRAPNTAREFSGYEYEQDRYGNFRAAYPDINNHAIDAARYGLSEVMARRAIKTIGGLKL